jgi:RNA polymerase sigma-70 factor (ECF subfamily)
MFNESLQVIVERAQQGSRDAFRVLFDRCNDRLFAYAFTHTGDRDHAMDLVQEVFIDLWKQLPRFRYRSEEEFMGFIFLILKRKIAKHHGRKGKTDRSLDEHQEEFGDTDITASADSGYEDHRWLEKGIRALSETSQEIIALRHWSDLSFGEISEILDITENAAKVRHHRAVGELRDILATYGYERS